MSEKAEYAYAWLFASVVTRGLRRLKTAAPRSTRMSWLGFKPRFFRSRRQSRQAVTGRGIARVVKGYKELASVTDDIGD